MALNVIFLGLSVLGVVPILESLINGAKGPQYVITVGIGEGDTSTDPASYGGNTPGVSLWTGTGEAIGGALGSKKIQGAGSSYTVSVNGNSSLGNGQAPAEYISVTNGGDDAICVAYVSVTEPTGTKRLFMGETGFTCNIDWFHSTALIGTQRPKCIWIDRDHSNGLRFQGMGIHLPSFSNSNDPTAGQGLAAEYQNDTDTMCKSPPRFKMYESINTEDPILFFFPPFTEDSFNDDGSDKDISKIINNPGRKTDINGDLANQACENSGCPHIIGQIDQNPNTNKRQAKAPWASDQLIVSHYDEHSAMELCNSEYSRGPDFVSKTEMKYCDMDTKTAWDVCSSSSATCCFDLDTQRMRPCNYGAHIKARTIVPNKTYNKVNHWGAEDSG